LQQLEIKAEEEPTYYMIQPSVREELVYVLHPHPGKNLWMILRCSPSFTTLMHYPCLEISQAESVSERKH
jgi:hypothetical protein